MAPRILVAGEILFDVYPEHKRLGGAPFNFAYHLHHFGFEVAFVSRIGRDAHGREIEQFLQQRHFPARFLQHDDTHPTGIVHVELDEKGVPAFTIVEEVAYDFIEPATALVAELQRGFDVIYIGTLAQRHQCSRATIRDLLRQKSATTRVFYDVNLRQSFYTHAILEHSLQASDIVKVNEDEFEVLKRFFGISGDEADAAARLRQRLGLELLCLTRGAAGSVLYYGDRQQVMIAGGDSAGEIVDTVGAGDGYSAALVAGLLAGAAPGEMIRQASRFAASVCTISGAIPEDRRFYAIHAPNFE